MVQHDHGIGQAATLAATLLSPGPRNCFLLSLLQAWDGKGLSGDGLAVLHYPLRGVEPGFFVSLFLAASGLGCCVRAFSSCSERGLLFVVARGLLIAVASLVVEHGL